MKREKKKTKQNKEQNSQNKTKLVIYGPVNLLNAINLNLIKECHL